MGRVPVSRLFCALLQPRRGDRQSRGASPSLPTLAERSSGRPAEARPTATGARARFGAPLPATLLTMLLQANEKMKLFSLLRVNKSRRGGKWIKEPGRPLGNPASRKGNFQGLPFFSRAKEAATSSVARVGQLTLPPPAPSAQPPAPAHLPGTSWGAREGRGALRPPGPAPAPLTRLATAALGGNASAGVGWEPRRSPTLALLCRSNGPARSLNERCQTLPARPRNLIPPEHRRPRPASAPRVAPPAACAALAPTGAAAEAAALAAVEAWAAGLRDRLRPAGRRARLGQSGAAAQPAGLGLNQLGGRSAGVWGVATRGCWGEAPFNSSVKF